MAAPRSIWNGTIALGAIGVPVKVHSATEDRTVHFHEVHGKDGARIEHKRICSKEGKEVPYEQVVKGYELGSGEYVVLEKEEIAAAGGERSKIIELEEFVPAAEVDPVYYDRTYYLGARDAKKAYRLLHDALEKAERAALGRWVFHNREYLVAIRPLNGLLALHTVRFHDELVDGEELDVPHPSRAPSKREIEMAGTLVDSLAAEFEPEEFEDTYRERVLAMIGRKAKGEAIDIPEPQGSDSAPDLLAALEASLSGSKS